MSLDVAQVNKKFAFGLCVRLINVLSKIDLFLRCVWPATDHQELHGLVCRDRLFTLKSPAAGSA